MRLLPLLFAAIVALAGCASDAPPAPTDPLHDSDGDGFPDALEEKLGSDPHNATSVPDVMVHTAVSTTGTASVTVGTDGLGQLGGCGLHGQLDIDQILWVIEAPVNATQVHVTDLVFTLTLASPTLLDADMFIFNPAGQEIGQSTAFNVQTGPTETLAIEGKHPVGEYTVEVRGCSGSGDVRIDMQGTLGYVPSVEELLHSQGVKHEH